MTSGFVNHPDLVVLEVQPLTSLLYPAYEVANMAARQFFEERGEEIEPYQYASTVRYVAKRHILSQGVPVDYDFSDVANNGLKLRYGRYAVRCRKLDRRQYDGGEIILAPSPGDSEVMQNFYAQQIEPVLPGMPIPAPELNVLFLWDYSAGFVELFLSCPASGSNSRRSVVEYWWRPLAHPADEGSGSGPPTEPEGEPQIGYEQIHDEDDSGTGTGND